MQRRDGVRSKGCQRYCACGRLTVGGSGGEQDGGKGRCRQLSLSSSSPKHNALRAGELGTSHGYICRGVRTSDGHTSPQPGWLLQGNAAKTSGSKPRSLLGQAPRRGRGPADILHVAQELGPVVRATVLGEHQSQRSHTTSANGASSFAFYTSESMANLSLYTALNAASPWWKKHN